MRADREVVEPAPVTEDDARVQAVGLTVVGHRDPHRHLLAFEAPPQLRLGLGRHRLRARPVRQGEGEGEQHPGSGGESKNPGDQRVGRGFAELVLPDADPQQRRDLEHAGHYQYALYVEGELLYSSPELTLREIRRDGDGALVVTGSPCPGNDPQR